MKRSELTRKTPLRQSSKPMKQTAIKAKKKPKKSALQRKRDRIDSAYWNSKCHKEVARWAHGQPCAVCGKTEREHGVGIAAHHIIRKSRSRFLRWEALNLLPLCDEHHRSSIEIAAHSDNPLAVAEFVLFLSAKCPLRHEWLEKNAKFLRRQKLMVGPKPVPDWRKQYDWWKEMP